MNCRIKAFTLIELLVVIAILALLMSILMPALNRVREQANSMVCKSNLRQYGIAGTMYVNDNDLYFPYAFYWLYTYKSLWSYYPVHPLVCRWHDDIVDPPDGSLWPYLKAKKIHMCPTFKSLVPTYGTKHAGHVTSININAQYSYAINGFIAFDKFNPNAANTQEQISLKVTTVKSPGEVFFFSEENLWTIPGISTFALNDNSIGAGPRPLDSFATYHSTKRSGSGKGGGLDKGVANAVFVDGHVSEVKAKDTIFLSVPDRDKYRDYLP